MTFRFCFGIVEMSQSHPKKLKCLDSFKLDSITGSIVATSGPYGARTEILLIRLLIYLGQQWLTGDNQPELRSSCEQAQRDTDRLSGRTDSPSQGGGTFSNPVGSANKRPPGL